MLCLVLYLIATLVRAVSFELDCTVSVRCLFSCLIVSYYAHCFVFVSNVSVSFVVCGLL